MKFSTTFAILSMVASATTAKITKSVELPSTLSANSKMGKKILSEARQLEQDDEEVDMSWVVDYSIKFQGCHHISQWNGEADGDEDVRIATKRLIRFRLCPTDSCDAESSSGCSSGYGEYIIDMDTYLMAYMEDKQELEEWNCQYYEENVCACDDDDGKDDGFDEEQCMNNCYAKYGLDYCVEEEQDDAAGEPFELEDYIECAEFKAPDERRRAEEEEVEYFIGPYCSSQGGKVYLGMFTDDSCSIFADDYAGTSTYKGFTGEALPYSSTSIVGMECVTCAPLQDANEENNNNGNDDGEVEVKEMCEQMWDTAGKCEKNLGAVDEPNKNACNYMDGIKIVRKDGVVEVTPGSKAAAAFIGVFGVSTVLLAGYVYYLSTKVSPSKIDIN